MGNLIMTCTIEVLSTNEKECLRALADGKILQRPIIGKTYEECRWVNMSPREALVSVSQMAVVRIKE